MVKQNSANLSLQNALLESLAAMSIGAGNKILLSTAGNGAAAGTLDFQSGSNSNGIYYRLGNLQVCFKSQFSLPNSNLARCSTTWTYPAAFKAGTVPALKVTTTGITSTLSFQDLAGAVASNPSNVSSPILVDRVRGLSNFSGSDSVEVSLVAFGEWQ